MSYFQFHIWDVILPIDELVFFKMVIAPPASMLGGHWSKWSKPRMNIHKSHRSFSVFIRVPSDLTDHYTYLPIVQGSRGCPPVMFVDL